MNAPNETATSRLREEHQLILKVTAALETLMAEAVADWRFDTIADCVTFIRLFADACHHGKEEALLFPELEAAGMPRDQGPIAVMLYEHEQGRAFARRMADSLTGARDGEERALAELRLAATSYVELIRAHIAKEDHVLFEMADQVVSGPACRALCTAYADVCAGHFEGRTKEDLRDLAARIYENAFGPADLLEELP